MALLWTEVSDVRERWLGVTPLEATDAQISTLLEDAEDTILREFPDIEDRMTDPDNPLPARTVVKVAARMVIRHIRNPEGVRTTQETAGVFSESRTSGGTEPGAMYLTDDERNELAPVRKGKAFSIDQTPASWTDPEPPNLWLTIGRTYFL